MGWNPTKSAFAALAVAVVVLLVAAGSLYVRNVQLRVQVRALQATPNNHTKS